MLIFGFLLKDVPKTYQVYTSNIHKVMGVITLVLMLARLLWLRFNNNPSTFLHVPKWQRWLEHGIHISLYVTIIAMPLVGWMGSSSANKAPHLGGMILKLPIPQDRQLVKVLFEIHNYLAFVIIGLISLHLSAALYHYYILKDELMMRMMPKQNKRLFL